MFDLKLFVGVNLDPSFEKKKKLFSLFELESVEFDKKLFLGKTISAPTELQEFENFEEHVVSLIKRVNPAFCGSVVIFPK